VMMKHPGAVLMHKGLAVLLVALSALLMVALLTAAVIKRRQWRPVMWLVLPWLFVVAVMSMVKQVEARNVAGTRVVQAAAAGVVIEYFIARRRRKRGARWAQPSPTAVPEA